MRDKYGSYEASTSVQVSLISKKMTASIIWAEI